MNDGAACNSDQNFMNVRTRVCMCVCESRSATRTYCYCLQGAGSNLEIPPLTLLIIISPGACCNVLLFDTYPHVRI